MKNTLVQILEIRPVSITSFKWRPIRLFQTRLLLSRRRSFIRSFLFLEESSNPIYVISISLMLCTSIFLFIDAQLPRLKHRGSYLSDNRGLGFRWIIYIEICRDSSRVMWELRWHKCYNWWSICVYVREQRITIRYVIIIIVNKQ